MLMNHPYKPVHYFTAVFATTSMLWGVGAWMSAEPGLAGYYMLPMLLGLMAPFVIAVQMLRRSDQLSLHHDFMARLLDMRLVRPATLLAMLALMPISVLVSIGLSMPLGGFASQFAPSGAFSFTSGFVPVLLLLFLAASFEELGWRGYGFESLQQHYSFLTASLIFGVLWSAWHLPLLFVVGSYQYEIFHASPWYAVNFYVSTVIMGVIISWVCARNRRSILAAILFHFVINLSQEALSMTQATKSIQTGVLAVFAILLVVGNRKLFFSPPLSQPAPIAS